MRNSCKFDPDTCYFAVNEERGIIIIIQKVDSCIDWTSFKGLSDINWNLHVIYWNRETQMFFVNSTDKGISDKLADGLFSAHDKVNGEVAFRCLHGIKRLMLGTVGLKSGIDGPVRYRMFAGIDIKNGISESQIENSYNGKNITPDKGTPQGGILSPLLSNIVLNELDWWIASQWAEMPTHYPYKHRFNKAGSEIKSHTYRALRQSKLKEMHIVRYADDFKIFCRSHSDAVKTFEAVRLWLKDRLGLEISPEKSKVINLKQRYSEFLGFKLKVGKKGNFKGLPMAIRRKIAGN